VAQGTKPIIYDEHGVKVEAKVAKPTFKLLAPLKKLLGRKPVAPSTHLMPSLEVSCMHRDLHPLISNHFQRGIHNIEHQITYPGSNFIFHDSQGFESGASGEIEIVWKFIEKKSTAIEMKDQLHGIYVLLFAWLDDNAIHRYCIPMDSPCPLLSTELGFFNKGTGKGKFNHLFF
jgi:hypothetical protein